MRARVLLSLAGVLIAAVALVSASGAATTKAQKVTKINVSTRAAVVHYLRSIHVNAKHAVVQRGVRNYAGAHCPGTHWTCANTKHTVVQIAKQGGQNRFVCRSSKCVVVQISGTSHGVYVSGRISAAAPNKGGGNSGVCVKTGSGATTGGGQTCVISQTGNVANTAGIYENTNKVSGLVQTAQYTASITQTSTGSGAAGNNTACVTQNISQDGSTSNTNGKATTVNLQAYQTITITQNTLTGNNSAQNSALSTGNCDFGSTTLMQSQTQTSTVAATGNITQSMNPLVNGTTGGNVSLDIEQNQDQLHGFKGNATGTNSANFTQTTNQTAIANAKNGKTVTQSQNAVDGDGVSTPFSGIVGTINQDSKGLSSATVTQSETQCEDAANTSTSAALTGCSHTSDAVTGITLNQTQNGPVGLFTPPAKSAARVPYYHKGNGKSLQTGAGTGVVDIFNLNQTSEQYADKTGGNTTVVQSNIMQGDCASSGNGSATGGTCTASQQATLNGTTSGTTSDGYAAGSIANLAITCTNGHGSCNATPPPAPTFVSGPSDPNPSASAAFNFTDPATGGVHFLCKIDGGTLQENVVDPCSSGTAFFQGYGPHTFKVAASDSHGNVSAYVPTTAFSWTNVPPDPTITSGPDQPNSESRDATFTFDDAESPVNFVCKLDGAASYTACPSTTPTYTGLSLGAHTLLVKATDTSTGLYQSIGNAEYDWTVVPYLTFEATDDDASAGWSDNVPGSSIDLIVGNDSGTYAQFTLHNFEGITIGDLPAEPTFTTDTFSGGAPRYEIDLDNGDYLFGYPSNAPYGRSWDLNCGSISCTPMAQVPWSDIQTAEGSAAITAVLVEADWPPGVSASYNISDFNFDSYDLSFFGNHFQT